MVAKWFANAIDGFQIRWLAEKLLEFDFLERELHVFQTRS